MLIPNRQTPNSGGGYRFGFNGMEKDDEVSGEGNSYTTHFRAYDVRLGRWKSLDPVVYPWQSFYVGFNNNPVYFIDPSGAEGVNATNDQGDATWSGDAYNDNTGEFIIVREKTNAQMQAAGLSPIQGDVSDEHSGDINYSTKLAAAMSNYNRSDQHYRRQEGDLDQYWKFTLQSGNEVYYTDNEIFGYAYHYDSDLKNNLLNGHFGSEIASNYLKFSMNEAGRDAGPIIEFIAMTLATEGIGWIFRGAAWVYRLREGTRAIEITSSTIETTAIIAETSTNFLKFGGDEAVVHFGRHADQIMKVTGKSAYNLKNYVDDANWIIQNGTYSSNLNGYYYFMGNSSKGKSLFGFVGVKNGGSTISTFHIKTAAQLGLK